MAQSGSGEFAYTRSKAFNAARMCHEAIDRLAGKKPDERHRDDLIREGVFDRLKQRLNECGALDVIQYSHKFIAHAADAKSRQSLTDNQQGITLNKLADCQHAICEVAHTVSSYLLWDTYNALTMAPEYDVYEHLDQPWLYSADLDALRDTWNQHMEAVEKWTDKAEDRFLEQ